MSSPRPIRLRRLVLVAACCWLLGVLVFTEAQAVYRDRAKGITFTVSATASDTLRHKTDFYETIWKPARNVLDGVSPYRDPHDPTYVAWTVYPPSAFLPALPLAALNLDVATIVFQLLLVVAAVLTLLVLGVRDWRCHALWLLTPLMLIPVLIANVTPVVVLCAALLWRYRDRAWIAAAALTVAVAVKLFLAPLWLWLVMTRRYRAAGYSAVSAPLVIVASWALIRFDGFLDYPATLRVASEQWGGDGAFVHASHGRLGLAHHRQPSSEPSSLRHS